MPVDLSNPRCPKCGTPLKEWRDTIGDRAIAIYLCPICDKKALKDLEFIRSREV